MEDIFAKMGLKGAHLFAGLIGGAFVAFFGRKPITWREKLKAFITVIMSAILTGYLTPLVILKYPTWESAEHGLAFLIGLFGMGVVHGLLNVVQGFVEDPLGTFKKVKSAIRG